MSSSSASVRVKRLTTRDPGFEKTLTLAEDELMAAKYSGSFAIERAYA